MPSQDWSCTALFPYTLSLSTATPAHSRPTIHTNSRRDWNFFLDQPRTCLCNGYKPTMALHPTVSICKDYSYFQKLSSDLKSKILVPYWVNVCMCVCVCVCLMPTSYRITCFGFLAMRIDGFSVVYFRFTNHLERQRYVWGFLICICVVHRCGASGTMRACHAEGPGSIPGRDRFPGWDFFGVFPHL